MAARKATGAVNAVTGEAEVPVGVQAVEMPTREDIYEAALWTARHTNRVPTFLGPTASGKTFGMQVMAAQNNAEVVTVLLGQHTPDEIAGFQLALKDEYGAEELKVAAPYWFKETQNILDRGKSAYILFDELGLSREEVRGALYTFFRDRHLHGHKLVAKKGQEVLVFAASNPAMFAPPFRSRCLFLHMPADRDYMLSFSKGNLARKVLGIAPISNESEDPAYSNAPPPPPVVVDASAAAVLNAVDDVTTKFWHLSEGSRVSVLAGVLPTQVLHEVLTERGLDASALAKDYDTLVRALRAMPKDTKHSMINNVIESFASLTPEERARALSGIQDIIYDDLTADDLLTYFSTQRSDSAVEAVSKIDPEYMEKVLREKELIFVDTNAKGEHTVGGTIATRVQKMVEMTANS